MLSVNVSSDTDLDQIFNVTQAIVAFQVMNFEYLIATLHKHNGRSSARNCEAYLSRVVPGKHDVIDVVHR